MTLATCVCLNVLWEDPGQSTELVLKFLGRTCFFLRFSYFYEIKYYTSMSFHLVYLHVQTCCLGNKYMCPNMVGRFKVLLCHVPLVKTAARVYLFIYSFIQCL